jgi:hypothetical protein
VNEQLYAMRQRRKGEAAERERQRAETATRVL